MPVDIEYIIKLDRKRVLLQTVPLLNTLKIMSLKVEDEEIKSKLLSCVQQLTELIYDF